MKLFVSRAKNKSDMYIDIYIQYIYTSDWLAATRLEWDNWWVQWLLGGVADPGLGQWPFALRIAYATAAAATAALDVAAATVAL